MERAGGHTLVVLGAPLRRDCESLRQPLRGLRGARAHARAFRWSGEAEGPRAGPFHQRPCGQSLTGRNSHVFWCERRLLLSTFSPHPYGQTVTA